MRSLFIILCLLPVSSFAAIHMFDSRTIIPENFPPFKEVFECTGKIQSISIANGGRITGAELKRNVEVFIESVHSDPCTQISFNGNDFDLGLSLVNSIGKTLEVRKRPESLKGEGVFLLIQQVPN